MADHGTVSLITATTAEMTAYQPLLVGPELGTVSLITAGVPQVDSYAIGGTTPCPDAPLVGQWWPR